MRTCWIFLPGAIEEVPSHQKIDHIKQIIRGKWAKIPPSHSRVGCDAFVDRPKAMFRLKGNHIEKCRCSSKSKLIEYFYFIYRCYFPSPEPRLRSIVHGSLKCVSAPSRTFRDDCNLYYYSASCVPGATHLSDILE